MPTVNKKIKYEFNILVIGEIEQLQWYMDFECKDKSEAEKYKLEFKDQYLLEEAKLIYEDTFFKQPTKKELIDYFTDEKGYIYNKTKKSFGLYSNKNAKFFKFGVGKYYESFLKNIKGEYVVQAQKKDIDLPSMLTERSEIVEENKKILLEKFEYDKKFMNDTNFFSYYWCDKSTTNLDFLMFKK